MEKFATVMTSHFVVQRINQLTRVTSETCTIIDLFITNNDESTGIIDSGVYRVSISDHN